jgi:hypothetical protein
MIRRLYIARFPALAVLLLLLLALAPAMAQNVAYTGKTSTLSVEQQPGDVYSWELYKEPTDPNFNFATEPGETSPSYAEFVGGISTGTTVNVLWKLPGIYFFKVNAWNITGCTNNIKVGIIEVKLGVTAEIAASPAVCAGETVSLTVTLTGTPPWDYTYTDGTNSWTVTNVLTSPNVITLTPGPLITTEYWITSVKDQFGINTTPSAKATQLINPLPAPSIIYHR